LPENSERVASRVDKAKMIQQMLFYLLVLVGIFSISIYAFKLWSRRFRQSLFHKPLSPTPSSDVWAMHRLPEELLAEGPSTDNLPPDKEIGS
jgi:hypothetical protein